jgi:hypothetical protein
VKLERNTELNNKQTVPVNKELSMGGIQFDPNAGGAQGPRETIAGHTFDAGQSAVINECKNKVAGLVKERNNASEHMPQRALQTNNELEQFLDTGVQEKLERAGLDKTEIKDVIQHFKETTGYKDLPANLSKMDSSVSRGSEPPALSRLDRDKQPVVRELMQDLTAKLNALESRVKQCETQEMKERVYNEGRAEIFPMILPGQVEKNLLDKGVATFTDDEILITVECLGQVLADKTREIREKNGIRG